MNKNEWLSIEVLAYKNYTRLKRTRLKRMDITILFYMQLYRTVKDILVLDRTIQEFTGLYKTIWNKAEPYRTITEYT